MGGGYTFLLFICITYFLTINADELLIRRQAIEIIIGGGGGIIGGGGGSAPSSPPAPEMQNCPPPPPPPCPPPPKSPSPPPPSPKPPSPPPPTPKSPSPPPPSPKPPSPPSPTPKSPSPPPPSPKPSPGGFESERLKMVFPVIQAFKKKIQSDPSEITKTWNGPDICKNYKGFLCGIEPKTNQKALAGVKFNNYNFDGPNLTISEFLLGLKDIVFFHANSNNFKGTIPERIGELPFLYELDLSNNKFNGTFPYQVLNAKKLLFLDLRFNTLEGIVPPQVFLLDLDLLFINNNKFVQKLPETLGSTTALYLTLANNKFIGGIPASIGQASNTLREVLFLNNQLTGCLPYEIGKLKKSTVFDVGFNMLTGPIPHSFQCLKKMELLNLAVNNFYGPVPEAVCGLPNLSNFTISFNYFTQVGPQCRKLINNGRLHVKMNCILDLPNQRSAADCAKFFSSHHSCPNEKSLTYVPCAVGLESKELIKSSDIEWNNAAPAPAQAPRARSYGSLSPH